MAYIITKVSDPEDSKCVGTYGPRATKLSFNEIKNHAQRKYFRLLDDDRNVMAYGYYVHEVYERIAIPYTGYEHSGYYESDEFEPLDCYGRAMWGCTIIQYRNSDTKKWEDV